MVTLEKRLELVSRLTRLWTNGLILEFVQNRREVQAREMLTAAQRRVEDAQERLRFLKEGVAEAKDTLAFEIKATKDRRLWKRRT